MENLTDGLTKSSHPEEYIDLGQDLSERVGLDLTGLHEAEIVSVHTRKSKDGNFVQNVGARILEGTGKDEVVFGPVFKNQILERFVRALSLDPAKVGSKLLKDQVIGKKILIDVATEEREGVAGVPETSWTIRGFAPSPDDGQR